ncbi:MAG: BolA/IbaG family iron-sulfur metabolism protein [Natronospirillum sp.]|uniref:BolA family protein n=1 Tax=Natronospirillum sp. TaxID=2812955 RepID=UPI0025CE9B44|nr:BolA/IbaG family iron-sulfur metabolism protein [Natronospirillum sp.]MCH8551613.1 BolA/IbaG family iron-sulfur metabolism protein [Natronospirillum sp.]
MTGPVQQSIEDKLTDALHPTYLQVDNESHMHNVPPGSESHFKVTLVADMLKGLPPVRRHQTVYEALKKEMAGPVHALAIHAYAPDEWQGQAPDSPACRGGSGQ